MGALKKDGALVRTWALGIVAAVGLLTAAGCSSPSEEGEEAPAAESDSEDTNPAEDVGDGSPGGILNVAEGAGQSAETLDPATTLFNHTQSYALFDRLTRLTPDMEAEPELADWTVDDDLTTYTFHLRDDVKWHDGKPLTADDVVHTFQRLMNPEIGSPIASVLRAIDPDQIVAIDDQTVEFRLLRPMWDLPDQVASNFASIVPAHISDDELRTNPIGSGPFVLQSFSPTELFHGTRNNDYWRPGAPLVDELRIFYVADASSRISGLLAGQFDIISNVPAAEVERLDADTDIAVASVPSGRFVALKMNATTSPFDDVRVRSAVKLAIDRQQIIDRVALGHATIGYDHPIPLVTHNVAAELPVIEQDLEQAKTLLNEAGYPDGIELPALLSAEYFPGVGNLGALVQEQLAAAGIEFELSHIDATSYEEQVFSAVPSEASFWAEPTNFRQGDALLSMSFASDGVWNFSGHSNADYDSALEDARRESNPELRLQKYKDALTLLAEDGTAAIPIFFNNIEAHVSNVTGYTAHPQGFPRDYWMIGLE